MATHLITKLNVSTTKDEEEILGAQGYQLINNDLNEGTGKNRVFLWYKKECGLKPVTRIQFSFNDKMKSGLTDAGYELVNRDLNAGAGGDPIFLWYFYGSTDADIPIVDLEVSKDAKEEPALLKMAGRDWAVIWTVMQEESSSICGWRERSRATSVRSQLLLTSLLTSKSLIWASLVWMKTPIAALVETTSSSGIAAQLIRAKLSLLLMYPSTSRKM